MSDCRYAVGIHDVFSAGLFDPWYSNLFLGRYCGPTT